MLNKFQAIQSIINQALSELGTLAGAQMNDAFSKVNDSLKIPGLLSSDDGVSVQVGNTTITLPNGRKESLIWGSEDFGNLSGSFNFSTGVGSGDIQSAVVPAIANGKFCKAGFEIRPNKLIYVIFGTVGDDISLAGFPVFSSMSCPLGYCVLRGSLSGLSLILNTDIYQMFSFSSVAKQHSYLTDRDAADSHPASAISLDTSGFSGELRATENQNQLAISRLEKFGSVFPWDSGNLYRVGNEVIYSNILRKCIVEHISGASFVAANWECLEKRAQEVFTVGAGGQATFTLSTLEIPMDDTLRLQVHVNGVKQIGGSHYTVDSQTQVTFSDLISENAEVSFLL